MVVPQSRVASPWLAQEFLQAAKEGTLRRGSSLVERTAAGMDDDNYLQQILLKALTSELAA